MGSSLCDYPGQGAAAAPLNNDAIFLIWKRGGAWGHLVEQVQLVLADPPQRAWGPEHLVSLPRSPISSGWVTNKDTWGHPYDNRGFTLQDDGLHASQLSENWANLGASAPLLSAEI